MTAQLSPRNIHLELKPEEEEIEILVVEDEDLMSALILRYLESSVIPSLGGVKPRIRILDRGWDLLQSDLSNVRVAVVDLLLPQVTGIDLIRNFRSRYPNMGIVPISGMATEPMRRNLNEILKGDFSLIDKPLRKESFKSAFTKAWKFWSPPKPEEFA
ncbi:MAG: response regulator [Bdellovibrionota bacterium]